MVYRSELIVAVVDQVRVLEPANVTQPKRFEVLRSGLRDLACYSAAPG